MASIGFLLPSTLMALASPGLFEIPWIVCFFMRATSKDLIFSGVVASMVLVILTIKMHEEGRATKSTDQW